VIDEEVALTIIESKVCIMCFETIVWPFKISVPMILSGLVLNELGLGEVSIALRTLTARPSPRVALLPSLTHSLTHSLTLDLRPPGNTLLNQLPPSNTINTINSLQFENYGLEE